MKTISYLCTRCLMQFFCIVVRCASLPVRGCAFYTHFLKSINFDSYCIFRVSEEAVKILNTLGVNKSEYIDNLIRKA